MIGVVADDFTGAAELAGIGWRRGLRAQVVLEGLPDLGAELVCIDTDSRACLPEEAARRAARAAQGLQGRGAQWVYKKTDSVLRGNVTSEIEAILGQLRLRGALLLPANPSLGRTIINGQYFIGGRLINETEFARDPNYPRRSAEVLELLAAPVQAQLTLGRPFEPLPEAGIVVGDVTRSADLAVWASRKPVEWLMAGGAEFFSNLLLPGFRAVETSASNRKALFVSGTTSESATRFAAIQESYGVPVLSLPRGLAHADDITAGEFRDLASRAGQELIRNGRLILRVGLPLISEPRRSSALAEHLVQWAAAVLEQTDGDAHIFAEGGATAAALARRMGWKSFSVLEELAQGVVTLQPSAGARSRLTIKPGSYSWPDSVIGPASPANSAS